MKKKSKWKSRGFDWWAKKNSSPGSGPDD